MHLTESSRALLRYLNSHPGADTLDCAEATGIAKATAAKLLSDLYLAGLVARPRHGLAMTA